LGLQANNIVICENGIVNYNSNETWHHTRKDVIAMAVSAAVMSYIGFVYYELK